MSTSKAPIDIVQEGEKNPRGIPKAIFIVRLQSFAPRRPPVSRFADLFIISLSPPSTPHPQNDVEEYLGGPDAAVERVLSAFQDALACVYLHKSRIPCHAKTLAFFSLYLTYSTSFVPTDFWDDFCRKYRYMDSNLAQRRRGLEEKIPDIKKTLSMVEFLRDRRVRFSHSFLSDHLSGI